MNFANSSSKPQSSYHRGSSYYHGHHNKYSRHQHGHHSNHRGARSSSQHQGYGAYHPRIINTTASSSNNPSNSNSLSPIKLKPATAPQQNQQLQAKAAHANNNNINTNTHKPTTYHFSAKSSEMFMKKKIMTNSNANITPQSNQQSLTSNNTQKPSRFDSKPAFSPNGMYSYFILCR